MAIVPRTLEDSLLDRAISLLTVVQLELEAKGYPPSLVAAALSRARGTAEYKSQPISPQIRGQAFLDLLTDELKRVEPWLNGVQGLRETQTMDISKS